MVDWDASDLGGHACPAPQTASGQRHGDDPEPDRFPAALERVARAARLLDQGDSVREVSAELRQALRDLGEDPPGEE